MTDSKDKTMCCQHQGHVCQGKACEQDEDGQTHREWKKREPGPGKWAQEQ